MTDDQKIYLLYCEALMERLSLYRLQGNDLHDVNESSFLPEILLNLENNLKRCCEFLPGWQMMIISLQRK